MTPNILLITPPFVQLNTPYPATPYLKGFLNTKNIKSTQIDFGIELILQIFSKQGLTKIFSTIAEKGQPLSENCQRIYQLNDLYINTIDHVIHFLQNKNNTLSNLIIQRSYLPEASRFQQLDDLEWAFGNMGNHDKARHLCTLYLEDISDLIIEAIDSNFGFSRYAERLGRSAATFDELDAELNKENTYFDEVLLDLLGQKLSETSYDLVLFSVPFPGNLYCAFKMGQYIKKNHPQVKIIMGGGFPNTELRSLSDARVFAYVDFITLDDGEAPLWNLIQFLQSHGDETNLVRTFSCEKGQVKYHNNLNKTDYKQSEIGFPDYSDLPLEKYLSVIEIANPMHSLWSNGRWNKLMLAHGCYWANCSFCDTSLDYINRFDPMGAKEIVDKIEKIIEQTGETGFHFVDEAAPPNLLRVLALEIIRRKLTIVWWTNIRFEKSFTSDLCRLLAASGCIAISGGLEVASDRLLRLINKGVTVSQVAKAASNFTEAGIMVHAYLMYGFPTQTAQETIDSLEIVRQLFEQGIVHSAFWHQFAMTAHSPVGLNPQKYKAQKVSETIGSFANNDVPHLDTEGCDHELFSDGLKKALFNYMHGLCFDFKLKQWFDFKVPQTIISPNYIEDVLVDKIQQEIPLRKRVLWLGQIPTLEFFAKTKKGKTVEMCKILVHTKQSFESISVKKDLGIWLLKLFTTISIENSNSLLLEDIKEDFITNKLGEFTVFWNSYSLVMLRQMGLLLI
ncbi:MAG: radical SAM protein [Marinilabiliaceae bacterium]|nr:radical SAM protein [Marinilabiliaceae bacterium]